MKYIIAILLTLLMYSNVIGQVGKETGLWKWTGPRPYHSSVVRIDVGPDTDSDKQLDYIIKMGSGTVINIDKSRENLNGYYGYELTAYHVINQLGNNKITVYYNNNASNYSPVYSYDSKNDLALVKVWVPKDVEPAILDFEPVEYGDDLEFSGFGGGCPVGEFRSYSGHAAIPTNRDPEHPGVIYSYDGFFIPGDSGGGIFKNGKLVGVIQSGLRFFDYGLKDTKGQPCPIVFPSQGIGVGPILKLMKTIK